LDSDNPPCNNSRASPLKDQLRPETGWLPTAGVELPMAS
jgi:hypothetical protein